ncbi:MAG: nuclear transport factor 2 family protein [Gammaproteobacteria bacterium]|nr:nuclear transport factor 2 family protein [Gammaproteobacteria bacterium]
MKFFFRVCLILSSVVFIQACNTGTPDPQDVADIRAVLAKRAEAIQAKDINAYRSVLHEEYFDGKYHLEDLISDMSRAFDHYASLEFRAQRAPVETKMNSARVVQSFVYQLEGREKPIEGREILLLRHFEDGWKISGGVYVGLD